MKYKLILHVFPALLLLPACNADPAVSEKSSFPELSGPFFEQNLPDSIPEIFAPGIVSTGMFTRDVAISPDGKEIYWCVSIGNYSVSTIVFSRLEKGLWTAPEIVPFSGGPEIMDFEPAFSPDGKRLYFLSTRPDGDEEAGDQDIWYVEREGKDWGEPVNAGPAINTDGGEFFPSLTSDGTLYFTRNARGSRLNQVYRSRQVNGRFQEPELLPEEVNCGTNRFNVFVSPDESYVIVPAVGMEDAYDAVDYYIVFRDVGDRWSGPINMGAAINEGNERGWSPYVSPDGRAFFFMSSRHGEIEPAHWNYNGLLKWNNTPGNGTSTIYWVNASLITALRERAHPNSD